MCSQPTRCLRWPQRSRRTPRRQASLDCVDARMAARDAVRSPRFQRLLLSIGAFCAEPVFGAQDRPVESARTFAAKLLTHRHATVLERGTALESGTAEERHAVRIAAKKLRYA